MSSVQFRLVQKVGRTQKHSATAHRDRCLDGRTGAVIIGESASGVGAAMTWGDREREEDLTGTMNRLVLAIQQLAGARSIDEIAAIVRTVARELVSADGATFVLRKGNNCYYFKEDAISPLWQGREFPLENCISGWAMLNRQQVSLPDVYADERIPKDVYRPTFVKSLVMTPVRGAEPVAAIGTYWAYNHTANPRELSTLQTLADSTALAMENVHILSDLEDRVSQRTTELAKANEQLQIARDTALMESKFKSNFVATISHELRTPLSGIICTSELLAASQLETEQTELVDLLQVSARGLLSIINDVLDLARIESGHIALENIPFNLLFLVQDSARAMAVAARAKGLSLHCSSDYMLPEFVLGDPVRLRQILNNLLGNAIKFTSQGEITVITDMENISSESVTIKFTVKDTGIGMTEEQREHLFEPFVQADETISRRFGGTGLGLAISKQIVDLMGGTLNVASEIGKGSTFTFKVRFGLVEKMKLEETSDVDSLRSILQGTVLIVEDDEVTANLTLKQLNTLGLKGVIAGDGEKAAHIAGGQLFDLILMDCDLPVLNGCDCTRIIREREKDSGIHTPIVAITAGAMLGDEQKCLDAGMDDFLCKPVTMA